ncbi:sortase domain-containing protein [Nocardioides panzhihuensis]|uniref:LPXTG-site transpeptidase (Sortase) family protein n=1 Tax=Nocardioides panzhihuensis TaxID=860243 RepID=A0A7Z0IQ73_9ACTN|nr:LPXTG-site transpeptidase (sortase) family protein [Nocardioides panzhihuensis]
MAENPPDSPSRFAAAASGLWTALVVLSIAMVLAGLVWPSGSAATEVPPGAPQRLELPGLNTKARVVPIRLDGEVLDPPRNPREIGWWVGSAKPGSAQGQTVVTGHTVHTGGGSLNKLDHIEEGQEVDIVTKDGTFQHQVDSVEVLSRKELAEQAQRIFGQDHGDGRLVVITCTDWNGSSYDSNIVVFAHRFNALPKPEKKS